MSMNEAETRYHLIDPHLRDKGYTSRHQITLETILTPPAVEPTGAKGRRRKGPGRTDYLLCVQVGDMPKAMPIAVLEAKKESEDPLKGMQQAKNYADCKRFDAKYVFATNGHRYGEFDFFTSLQDGPFPFPDFPSHAELTSRYAKDTGIDLTSPEATMLFQPDRARAREEMQPLRNQAAAAKVEATDLKEQLKRLKKRFGTEDAVEEATANIAERERGIRDLEAQIAAIDEAVYDLKAVNPNAVVKFDERTVQEIISSISEHGKVVSDALSRLNSVLASPTAAAGEALTGS